VIVRPARLEEFANVGRLRNVMADEEGLRWSRDHPGWQQRYAEYFRAKQERGLAQVFFAVRGEEIVGMAAFSLLDEYRVVALDQQRGWVNSVFVLPELRRRGIARRIMELGIAWLRERGCVKARLRTSDDGEPLYVAMGFVRGREMELDL
jgi:GNAT superfamily N-acetyltransferase